MTTITHNATIQSITPFERENTHVQLRWPEKFVAITLQGEDGMLYVTFTRKHSAFAESAKVGDEVQFTGKFKRDQNYANLGGQVVLTNCVFGTYKYQKVNAKRAAKVAARKARLGI